MIYKYDIIINNILLLLLLLYYYNTSYNIILFLLYKYIISLYLLFNVYQLCIKTRYTN